MRCNNCNTFARIKVYELAIGCYENDPLHIVSDKKELKKNVYYYDDIMMMTDDHKINRMFSL